MKITFLGTGTSQGVPIIGCDCKVCKSTDYKDNRLRTSVLIEIDKKNIVIDTGPDFRQQMLRENVQDLDAVLFTHEHKDHLAGLDDVRPFNFKHNKNIPVYATTRVQSALKREFSYIFSENKYPGTPEITLHTIDNKPFMVEKTKIIPIEVSHYEFPVTGFRINNLTYITDAKEISKAEQEKIKGSEIIIINALRKEIHYSHFNLEEALALVKKWKPKKAYFTHISHLMGLHGVVSKELPPNVEIAYDGLCVELKG